MVYNEYIFNNLVQVVQMKPRGPVWPPSLFGNRETVKSLEYAFLNPEKSASIYFLDVELSIKFIAGFEGLK